MAGTATRILRLVSPCLIALAVFLAMGAGPAAAAGEGLRPDPQARVRILNQPPFSIFVRADNVTNLYGYQFTLNYNNRSTISSSVGTLTAQSPGTALTSAVTTLSAATPDTTLFAAVNSTTLFANMFNTTVASAMPTTTLTNAIINATDTGPFAFESTGNIHPGATTLTIAITSTSSTTVTLATTDGIFANDTLRIDSENMRVMSIDSANIVTVTRGVQGTAAATHLINAPVAIRQTLRIDAEEMSVAIVNTVTTATVVRGINGTTAVPHGAAALVLIEPAVLKVASINLIANGNLLRIDGEEVSVTNVNAVNNVLTVTRAQSGTTPTTHNFGAVVVKQPSTADVGSAAAFSVGNTIQIDQEKMTVTAKAGNTLTVTRAVSGTLPAVHLTGALVLKQPDTIQVVSSAGLSVGNDIQVEGERMTITGIAGSGPYTLTVTRAVNSLPANHAAGAPVVRQPTDITVASSVGISPGSVLQVGSEQMSVTGVAGSTLTVNRGWNATGTAMHAMGATVSLLTLGAGAAAIKVNADVIGAVPASIAIGGGNSETKTVSARSGSGPYTYTLSSPTALAHAAGGAVTAQPSVLALSSTGGLVPGSTIQVDLEEMTVTAVNVLNVTATRGVNGTAPAIHANGALVTAQVIAAGATSIASVSDIFPNVKLPALLLIEPDTGVAETRTVTAKSGSGAGPYRYTLSAATSFAHAAGTPMQNPALTPYNVRQGAWTQVNASKASGATSLVVRADVLADTPLPAPIVVGYGDNSQEAVTVTIKAGQTNGYYTYTLSAPTTKGHAVQEFVAPAVNTTQPGTPKTFLESTGRAANCTAPVIITGQVNYSCSSLDYSCPTPYASTTLSAATVLGSGQLSVVSDILAGVALPAGIVIQRNTPEVEAATVTAKSGSGPFTYTLQPVPPSPSVPAFAHAVGTEVIRSVGCVALNGPNGNGILATVFFVPGAIGKGKLEFAPAGAPQTFLAQYNPSNPTQPIQIVAGAGLSITQGEASVIRCPDMNDPPLPPPPTVSFADFLKLAAAYYSLGPSQPGGPSPNWNPAAELNGDDVVAFADLLVLASVFNQTCP